MLIIKAWGPRDPQQKSPSVPVVFRVESCRLQAMPGNASGRLHVAPPRQPILIGPEPGQFARIEIYTAAEVRRETVWIEAGQLRRDLAPIYKVWVEHLGQLGTRVGYEVEAQSAVFDPIRSSGEGFARLSKPDQVLRVAADEARLVRITSPDGQQSVMEYFNGCVTLR